MSKDNKSKDSDTKKSKEPPVAKYQCRWRNPLTEERCQIKFTGVVAYCEKHRNLY